MPAEGRPAGRRGARLGGDSTATLARGVSSLLKQEDRDKGMQAQYARVPPELRLIVLAPPSVARGVPLAG